MNPEATLNAVPPSGFAKLLATGLIGWMTGSIVLVAVGWYWAHATTVSIAAMWAISHWWIAFGFGAVLILVHSLMGRIASATALAAYLLPVALLTMVAGICLAIYPDPGFRTDLFGYMALVLFFYILGFLWMTLAPGGKGNTNSLRLLLPAMVGGLVVLALVAVPVFTSNLFIYRNAFDLAISKTSITNGAMIADAVLEVRKPGNYGFSAPRFIYGGDKEMTEPQPALEYGKITWGTAGEPKQGAAGIYPLQIRWEKNIPTGPGSSLIDGMELEMISLEVRDAAAPANDPFFNISAPLPPAMQ